MKKFNLYTVHNAEKLVAEQIKEENRNDYKYKKLNRKSDEILILNKKSFNKLTDESETDFVVVGRIRKRQLRYKDYEKYNTLVKQKNKKKIYGKATLRLNEESAVKEYDVKRDANRHIYGYAWVGDNKFIKVTTFNFLWLLIPLLILIALFCFLFFNHPDGDFTPFDFTDDTEITDTTDNTETEQAPLCYYVPFNEKTLISEEHNTIKLLNCKENEGNYYISYKLYIDDKPQYLLAKDGVLVLADEATENATSTTGLISPNRQVEVDVWETLEEGNHQLTVVATDFDFSLVEELKNSKHNDAEKQQLQEQATKPVTHTFQTTLVVEK